jgi:hypothetical protein
LVYLAWQKLVANQAGSECNNIQKLLKWAWSFVSNGYCICTTQSLCWTVQDKHYGVLLSIYIYLNLCKCARSVFSF